MTKFVYADTSSWENWQKEYEFGAFYIFPPKGIIEPIDDLRRKYDPKSNAYSQAHISLSESLKGPLTEAQLKELQIAISSVEPFEIHYGPLHSFPPYPGVAFAISPVEAFMKLRSVIHSTSIFKEASLNHVKILPHITIAEFITLEKTTELLQELSGKVPGGNFLCDAICYAVPNKDFYFERVMDIPIGKKLYE